MFHKENKKNLSRDEPSLAGVGSCAGFTSTVLETACFFFLLGAEPTACEVKEHLL